MGGRIDNAADPEDGGRRPRSRDRARGPDGPAGADPRARHGGLRQRAGPAADQGGRGARPAASRRDAAGDRRPLGRGARADQGGARQLALRPRRHGLARDHQRAGGGRACAARLQPDPERGQHRPALHAVWLRRRLPDRLRGHRHCLQQGHGAEPARDLGGALERRVPRPRRHVPAAVEPRPRRARRDQRRLRAPRGRHAVRPREVAGARTARWAGARPSSSR